MTREFFAFLLAAALLLGAVSPDAVARVRKPAASPIPEPQVESTGTAETRLIEVYKLVAQEQTRKALSKATRLVHDHPNFQLAQLVYGDLLMAQTRPLRGLGDVPEAMAQAGAPVMEELRDESRLRLKALSERPPTGHIPSQFLALSPRNRHAIAVDASRSRLYLFENTALGLWLVADYYISVGKSGTEKSAEGDSRTPLGVYFITGSVNPKVRDFYGSGALPINYPNMLDNKRGKTGGGIWLHGTPSNQFSRPPLSTDGCVVLANPDLDQIIRTVEIRTTPVVISKQLQWVPPLSALAQSKPFEDALQAWRSAKSSGNMDRLLSFYTPDFNSYGKTLSEFTPTLRGEVKKFQGRTISLKDVSFLRWTDAADTMVVTFGEVTDGTRSGVTKRQYWTREGSQWKIFFEGVIG